MGCGGGKTASKYSPLDEEAIDFPFRLLNVQMAWPGDGDFDSVSRRFPLSLSFVCARAFVLCAKKNQPNIFFLAFFLFWTFFHLIQFASPLFFLISIFITLSPQEKDFA